MSPLRILLAFASLATVGVALWLFWVIATVLPGRDPGHISLWRTVAICMLVYSSMGWAYLILGPRHFILRWCLLVLSVGAVGLGLYGIVDMLRQAKSGGHFEGSIVLMGLVLCAHGISAFVYSVRTARSARLMRST